MLTWLIIRFVLGAVLLTLALHVVLRNSAMTGWYATLGATEFGARLALAAFVLLMMPGVFHFGFCGIGGSATLLAATGLFLLPTIRASQIARTLDDRMEAAFGRPIREPSAAPRGGAEEIRGTTQTLVYSPDGHEPLQLIYYRSAGVAAAPCLIILHGGGWEKGNPRDLAHWNDEWAARGFAVAALQYRLAPEHRWPAQRDDVRQALDFLKRNSSELGIDAERFVLLGRSAGGQIATACAYGLHDLAVRGVISIYAPADMFLAREYARSDDLLDSLGLVRRYLGGDPHEVEEAYHTASGILLADSSSCPTLLLHGGHDTLVWVEQSRRLARKLDSLHVRHCYVELPWATHGFDWPVSGPGSRILRQAVNGFLSRVLA